VATVTLNKENFEPIVTDNKMVIVDFWAPWCGPCLSFAPTYEAVSEKHTDVVFAKLNTEEEPEIAEHFDIRSIPTLMVFREKVILFSTAGAMPASELEKIIGQAKEVDMAAVHEKIAAEERNQTENTR
jgi:thioredoxin 1